MARHFVALDGVRQRRLLSQVDLYTVCWSVIWTAGRGRQLEGE